MNDVEKGKRRKPWKGEKDENEEDHITLVYCKV